MRILLESDRLGLLGTEVLVQSCLRVIRLGYIYIVMKHCILCTHRSDSSTSWLGALATATLFLAVIIWLFHLDESAVALSRVLRPPHILR